MKQTNYICKCVGMLLAFLALGSTSAFASSNYYSKVNAKAVGAGKVYVSTEQEEVDAGKYQTEASASKKTDTQQVAFYLYAKSDDVNTKFEGWFDNAECSGEALSNTAEYSVTVQASSNSENAPTEKNYYAKFTTYDKFLSYDDDVREYVNIDEKEHRVVSPNVKPNGATLGENITFTSSNEDVVTISDGGILVPKKRGTVTVKAEADGLSASYLLTVVDNVQAGVTQIGNGDFEDWRGVSDDNHAPVNWNSFETAEGKFATVVKAQQVAQFKGGRPGSDGIYCVDIYSRSVLGIPAQGNLTLGCINAGSTSATDAANHNFSKTEDSLKSETIARVPSALKVWVKFVPGAANAEHPNARVAATVHDAYNYITYGDKKNDNADNEAHAIAQAEQNFPACDWKELTIPFARTGNMTSGQMYINVNISTNADPGEGQEGDHLYVDDIELVYDEPVTYDKYIVVGVNGKYYEPVSSPIEVTYNDNQTIDFNLKNFSIDGLYVGNITLPGLAIDENGNFAFDGEIQISKGDKEGVESWIGPELGNIPVALKGTINNNDDYFYVKIDIDFQKKKQKINVEVGDLANATVSVTDAKYATFCAPFTLPIPAHYQSAVSAKTISKVTKDNVLELTSVENNVIPANTPVVVEAEIVADLPVKGIYVKGTPSFGLLTGVYEKTEVPVGSYVLQNQPNVDGVAFYRVFEGNGYDKPVLPANRCYLTLPASGDANVKSIAFPTDPTAIDAVRDLLSGKTEIYDLEGRRLPALQKGMNIVNGKKVLVK